VFSMSSSKLIKPTDFSALITSESRRLSGRKTLPTFRRLLTPFAILYPTQVRLCGYSRLFSTNAEQENQ